MRASTPDKGKYNLHVVPPLGSDHPNYLRISSPALVIWGENDALIPLAYTQIFANCIKQSEVCIIPDCGHVPPLEQLDALNSAVYKFLG
ncbi:MAG: alpha/beta hydrolase [Gammaproteobacteria bacterium]|nr:alpha/beta hydrolase [Gammaproteobacteria bacterium]